MYSLASSPASSTHSRSAELEHKGVNPAKYRECAVSEFMEAYHTADASREDMLEACKIHRD
jgi:hypothetical protein